MAVISALSRVWQAYVEFGVTLSTLLDGAGIGLALFLGHVASVDAGGLAAGDAHGGAGSSESCSAGEDVHFGGIVGGARWF